MTATGAQRVADVTSADDDVAWHGDVVDALATMRAHEHSRMVHGRERHGEWMESLRSS
jgi:hypothetical protein